MSDRQKKLDDAVNMSSDDDATRVKRAKQRSDLARHLASLSTAYEREQAIHHALIESYYDGARYGVARMALMDRVLNGSKATNA